MTYRIDVKDGLETAVDQLNSLFTGANIGKALVRVGDDPGPGPYAG